MVRHDDGRSLRWQPQTDDQNNPHEADTLPFKRSHDMSAPDLLARCLGYAPQLLDGAVTTLYLSLIAVVCGFFAGVFIHVLSASRNRLLAGFARTYVSVIRGTP